MADHRDLPPMWAAPLPEGLLVFAREVESSSDEVDPGYSIYRIDPEHPVDGALRAVAEGLEPVGRIPASDVEWDDARGGIQLHTMGIERFAAA